MKETTIYQKMVLGLLLLIALVTGGFKLVEIVSPETAQISNAVLNSIVGDVMDEKLAPVKQEISTVKAKVINIEKNQPTIQDNYDVRLMDFHLNSMTTGEQADKCIDEWENGNWGAQLTALKYVARHPEAMDYLSKVTVSEEVFTTFRIRASRYR